MVQAFKEGGVAMIESCTTWFLGVLMFFGYRTKGVSMIGTMDFPRSIQWDRYSCGARCAYMITKYFNLGIPYQEVKEGVGTDIDGTYMESITEYLRSRELKIKYKAEMTLRTLSTALKQGAIVLVELDTDHLGIVHGIDGDKIYLADPSMIRLFGRTIDKEEFLERWGNCGLMISVPAHHHSYAR